MKILWITDHTLDTRPAGGAELTDFFMIKEAEKQGMKVDYALPSTINDMNFSKYDLFVLSNNVLFSEQQREKIYDHKYIVFCHDALGWREFYQRKRYIFDKSILNIFLSPLHKAVFKEVENSICVPPYIPKRFAMSKMNKNNKVVYAGNIWDGTKGVKQLYEYIINHPRMTFDFYYHRALDSWIDVLKNLENVSLKGHISHNEMHMIFNQYEYFIHLPTKIEAFGRAVGEAYLCGCKIIGNSNIGAFSYEWSRYRSYFREKTLNSPQVFWENILNRL